MDSSDEEDEGSVIENNDKPEEKVDEWLERSHILAIAEVPHQPTPPPSVPLPPLGQESTSSATAFAASTQESQAKPDAATPNVAHTLPVYASHEETAPTSQLPPPPTFLPQYNTLPTAMPVAVHQPSDIENLTAAITLAIRAGQGSSSRITDLPQFYGAYQDWLSFRAAYNESSKAFGDAENVARLRRSLKGRAREAVDSLLISNARAEDIIRTLETRFGRPDSIAMAELERRKAACQAAEEESNKRMIKWRYICPGAPFMGGAWERMVLAAKKALQVTLQERQPSEEVLTTFLAEAEYTVNSRPLTHISVDPEDPDPQPLLTWRPSTHPEPWNLRRPGPHRTQSVEKSTKAGRHLLGKMGERVPARSSVPAGAPQPRAPTQTWRRGVDSRQQPTTKLLAERTSSGDIPRSRWRRQSSRCPDQGWSTPKTDEEAGDPPH